MGRRPLGMVMTQQAGLLGGLWQLQAEEELEVALPGRVGNLVGSVVA